MDNKHYRYQDDEKYDINYELSSTPPEVPIHVHHWFEIYYFISGDISYQIEGNTYQIKENDLLLINNQELHQPIMKSNKSYQRMTIHFDPDYIASFNTKKLNLLNCFQNRKAGHLNKVPAEKTIEYGIKDYFQEIKYFLLSNSPEKELMLGTLFLQLLIKLNKAFSNHQDKINITSSDEKIHSIIAYLNNNLDKKINLDLLAREFYLSKYYLCHYFKEKTGFTIKQYLTYKRVMKARQLLSEGKSCTETSQLTGFGDYSSFYRVFKKLVGISPGNYSAHKNK